MARFAAYDASGAPLAGLTPTWSAYFNAQTGAVVAGPAFTDRGGGLYEVSVPANECGIADLGATALNRYVFFGSTSVVTFPAFALADGTPLAGLVPSWSTIRDATGAAITPAPAIDALGGGIYRSASAPNGCMGIVNLGATANPVYVAIDNEPSADTTAPTVSNVSPVAGTTLGRFDPVTLDVTDVGTGLRLVVLAAQFAGGSIYEIVHDGTSFAPLYAAGSARTVISGGYHYSLARLGGWPGALTLMPFAVDQAGNENV